MTYIGTMYQYIVFYQTISLATYSITTITLRAREKLLITQGSRIVFFVNVDLKDIMVLPDKVLHFKTNLVNQKQLVVKYMVMWITRWVIKIFYA